MTEPEFVGLDEVMALHSISLQRHGGSEGLRDQGGLESAVGQAMNDYYYGQADLFGIAAAYAFHIAEAQAFVDGNKRTALATAMFFLESQGIDTTADQSVLYNAMIALATHDMDKAGLAALFRTLFASK